MLAFGTDLNVSIGNRGRVDIHIEVPGASSHSSQPTLGDRRLLQGERPEEVVASVRAHLTASLDFEVEVTQGVVMFPAEVPAEEGLDYDFERLRPANTATAHQVLHLAKDRGVQEAVKERLMAAHFVEGRHVGRRQELAELGAESGLEAAEVLEVLELGTFVAVVDEDRRTAARLGISGVPFYVVDGRYAVSGAQPAEVFVQVLSGILGDR
ncbi:MAG: DsbA family protein [Acidimicrobiia bacterium]